MKYHIPPLLAISWIAIFFMGFNLGMVIQQQNFIKGAVEIAEGLEGTNFEINIDVNETKLIEGFSEVLNETIKEINFTREEELKK